MAVIRFFVKNQVSFPMRDPTICPVCGGQGYGVHLRWAKEPKYGPYAYFAHPNGARNSRRWCYLGTEVTSREAPDSVCLTCPILSNCDPSSQLATCKTHQAGEGGTSPEAKPPRFFEAPHIPTNLSETHPGTSGEPNPSPARDKQCSRCGKEYPATTERRCTECSGFLIMANHGRFS